MESVFLKLVNMSITASYLIMAVIVFRLVLKKAPKYIRCILWGLVALRLVCPFSIESVLSLIPCAEPLPQEFLYAATPQVNTGIPAVNHALNPVIAESLAPVGLTSANPTQIWSFLFSRIWVIGMALMALYAMISYLRLRRKVAATIPVGKNIRLCDNIASPFILGILRPRIYLPSDIGQETADHVLAHEMAHIARKDHWWKPLGYLLLTVYWFNPFIWVAYILLCRDIELACDERVVKKLDLEEKKAYSSALLRCSMPRHMIAACPLAFGEVGVKRRIQSVLHYRKPAFWIILVAVLASVVVGVCFLTDPPEDADPEYDSIVDAFLAEDGYTILSQETLDIQIRILKSDLPDSIYSKEGQTFAPEQIIVYQSESTTFYLSEVRFANEGDDKLYFTFDSIYTPPESGTLTLICKTSEDGSTTSAWVTDKTLTDDLTAYPDAVSYRGDSQGTSFTVYVDTEVCRSAVGSLNFTVSGFAELSYKRSDGETNVSRLAPGVYIPVECIYMNPANSYYPGELSSDYRYTVTDQGFYTDSSYFICNADVDNVDWGWKTMAEAAEELKFLLEWMDSDWASIGGVQLPVSSDTLYQRLDAQTHLLLEDGNLYILHGSREARNEIETVWGIYRLEAEESDTRVGETITIPFTIEKLTTLSELSVVDLNPSTTAELIAMEQYGDTVLVLFRSDGELILACYEKTASGTYTRTQVLTQKELQPTDIDLVWFAYVEGTGRELGVLICMNENVTAIRHLNSGSSFTVLEQFPALIELDHAGPNWADISADYEFLFVEPTTFPYPAGQDSYIAASQVVVYDGPQRPGYYYQSTGEIEMLMKILRDVPEESVQEGLVVEEYCVNVLLTCFDSSTSANPEPLYIELRYAQDDVDLIIHDNTCWPSIAEGDLTYHIQDDVLDAYMDSLAGSSKISNRGISSSTVRMRQEPSFN